MGRSNLIRFTLGVITGILIGLGIGFMIKDIGLGIVIGQPIGIATGFILVKRRISTP